ncbi:uncharacterized protein A1O5_10423 [Cladophialophora psammophila CBS 110553]|uniref:Uncharacterized protein n=1 Tax=Cladophialophora psammophila CBS 110553 TaxID=1182543 RepID=W9WNN1_9EURO|nr:uncharacterized protein A1O5_10423 [Cladophialophora psammophila CBS 110553]EXJ66271.1 hypothetical protein A1O5_10423 [Cladophialophora psammophila CBS 110553]
MATFAASKKSRSAFSPPRPGKSKITKSTKEKGANTKSSGVHKQQRKAKVGQTQKQSRKPNRKGAAGTMRAILGEASSDSDPEDEDEDGAGSEDDETMDAAGDEDEDDDDDDADEDEDEEEESLAPDPSLNMSSPEPDFILAEVTARKPNASSTSAAADPAIPLPLIHRIMHAHFSSPERTSLSSDARQLVGKYTEIFVREAIRRCVDDKRERAAHGNGSGGGARDGGVVVGDTGWLEVEDLERIGVQLCLDF